MLCAIAIARCLQRRVDVFMLSSSCILHWFLAMTGGSWVWMCSCVLPALTGFDIGPECCYMLLVKTGSCFHCTWKTVSCFYCMTCCPHRRVHCILNSLPAMVGSCMHVLRHVARIDGFSEL